MDCVRDYRGEETSAVFFFFFFFRASKNIYAKFGRDTLIDIESFTRYTNTHILLLYI